MMTENYEFMLVSVVVLLQDKIILMLTDVRMRGTNGLDDKKCRNGQEADDLIELLVIKVMWYCYIWRKVS